MDYKTACARYVHRFTMEHIPAWARKSMPNGRFYAPQYASDREWFENTKFPGDAGYVGTHGDCQTSGQTWPLGQTLAKPYSR